MPAPKTAARKEFTVYDKDRLGNDLRLIMRFDADTRLYRAQLFDSSLKEIHSWIIYDPVEGRNSTNLIAPHGLAIFPDGSIVINWDTATNMKNGHAAVKYNLCGGVDWIAKGAFHHSFDIDDDGYLWTWLGEKTSTSTNQYIAKIDPKDGRVIKKISLFKDIIRPFAKTRAAFNFPAFVGDPDVDFEVSDERVGDPPKDLDFVNTNVDVFHPNDVEILKRRMADKFPAFKAGDLLISLRNLRLVAVIDSTDYHLKWWSHGPWVDQHDADFNDTGEISIFNNNVTTTGTSILSYEKRSNIYFVNPTTNEYRLLPFRKKSSFFSASMGKQQLVDGRTLVITVPDEGRVLEVDALTNELILEYNNVYNQRLNGHLSNAMHLASDYLKVDLKTLTCSK